MNKLLLILFCCWCFNSTGQTDTTKWARAFPITNYIVNLSDSMKVVQLLLPDGMGVTIADRQFGLLRGVYKDKHGDTAAIGTGRCYLRKGEYYYFTVNFKQSGKLPKEGDLLYTLVNKSPVYRGNIIRIATHYIGLQNVYEKPLYDRYGIFAQWTKSKEDALIDSMVADIRFTANYFLTNSPEMNVKIKGGKNDGKLALSTMQSSTAKDIIDFLEYIVVRPRLYAGRNWKISEIFATWLSEGAPTVIK